MQYDGAVQKYKYGIIENKQRTNREKAGAIMMNDQI